MVSQSSYWGIYPDVTVSPQFTITRQLGSEVADLSRPAHPFRRFERVSSSCTRAIADDARAAGPNRFDLETCTDHRGTILHGAQPES